MDDHHRLLLLSGAEAEGLLPAFPPSPSSEWEIRCHPPAGQALLVAIVKSWAKG